MRTFSDPLHTKAWRPPENGPSHPRTAKRRSISRRVIGLGMFADGIEIQLAEDRQGFAAFEGKNQPFLKYFPQVFQAICPVRSLSPHPRCAGQGGKDPSLLGRLKPSLVQGFVEVFS